MQMEKWERNCREENCFVYIWKKSIFQLTDGCGRKYFADRENASGKISLQEFVFTGHSIPK